MCISWEIVIVILLAVCLRVSYLAVTDHGERGYDVGGHIQYIEYLTEHHSIPSRHDGWQFYQPPLYYTAAAAVFSIAKIAGLGHHKALFNVQILSLVLTITSFLLCIWIAYFLFQKKTQRWDRFLFLLPLAALPGLVYLSARINNDVLYFVFAILSCGLMLRWWKKPSIKLWLLISVVLGLGLLSKTNAALLIIVAAILAISHPLMHWKQRDMNTLFLGAIVAILAGWFVFPPFFYEEDIRATVVGNVASMTGPIPASPELLFTFLPNEILEHPFNEPVGEVARRQYHMENFFRSIFFGEFPGHPYSYPFAMVILTSAMLLIPLFAISFIRDALQWTKSPTFPFVVMTVVLFVGAVAFRVVLPFSSSSDFRYSLPLVLPFVYYALRDDHPLWGVIRKSLVSLVGASAVIFLMILIGAQ